jgi:hypothetical protein
VTQPIPATKLLASHYRSGRGACGFVLVVNPEVSLIWNPLKNNCRLLRYPFPFGFAQVGMTLMGG